MEEDPIAGYVVEFLYTHHCRKRVHLVEVRAPLNIYEDWRVCKSYPLSYFTAYREASIGPAIHIPLNKCRPVIGQTRVKHT